MGWRQDLEVLRGWQAKSQRSVDCHFAVAQARDDLAEDVVGVRQRLAASHGEHAADVLGEQFLRDELVLVAERRGHAQVQRRWRRDPHHPLRSATCTMYRPGSARSQPLRPAETASGE